MIRELLNDAWGCPLGAPFWERGRHRAAFGSARSRGCRPFAIALGFDGAETHIGGVMALLLVARHGRSSCRYWRPMDPADIFTSQSRGLDAGADGDNFIWVDSVLGLGAEVEFHLFAN